MTKSCFVIMPIGTKGTPDHQHFHGVFNQLAPVVRAYDYDVERADEITQPGAITKDIVTRLGTADLVVADLTDLNPNVLYELGVRHALRGKGTIIIRDTNRTPKIPFNLKDYRVIDFVGDIKSIDNLKTELEGYLSSLTSDQDPDSPDNPVHDWFPTLPANAILAASEGADPAYVERIGRLKARITQFENLYGKEIPDRTDPESPLLRLDAAVSDAEDDLLPASLFARALLAYTQRNVVQFITVIKTIVERKVRVGTHNFLQLSKMSGLLALGNVRTAVLDHAVRLYPRDRQIATAYYSALAHSDEPRDVKRAIELISNYLRIRSSDGSIALEKASIRDDLDLKMVVVLLDCYQREGLHEQELEIAKGLLALCPQSSLARRNYGRALEATGSVKDALSCYREAIFADDTTDQSAVWLGKEFHNRGRPREAAEAFALSCVLDPADADNFAHLMEELSDWHLEGEAGVADRDDDDARVDLDSMLMAHRCALSCPDVGERTRDRLGRVIRALEIESPEHGDMKLKRRERLDFARRIYAQLKSDLTTRGSHYNFDFIGDTVLSETGTHDKTVDPTVQ